MGKSFSGTQFSKGSLIENSVPARETDEKFRAGGFERLERIAPSGYAVHRVNHAHPTGLFGIGT